MDIDDIRSIVMIQMRDSTLITRVEKDLLANKTCADEINGRIGVRTNAKLTNAKF